MKKKSILSLLVISISAVALFGCGNNGENGQDLTEEIQVDEESETEASNEEIDVKEDNVETADDANSEDNEDAQSNENEVTNKNSEFINNNSYFISNGESVFYHMPDEDAMDKTALWGEFMASDCGYTTIYKTDLNSFETEPKCYDSGWGKFALGNEYMLYQGYTYNNDEPCDSVLYYTEKEEHPIIVEMTDMMVLGSDSSKKYVYCSSYVSEKDADEILKPGYYLWVYHDEQVTDPVYMEFPFEYVCADENIMIYTMQRDNEDTTGLYSIDIKNGDILYLGPLPEFEYGWGEIDQAILDGTKLYLSYGNYDGTGHFFSGCQYVWADIEACESIDYFEPEYNANEELGASPAFYVSQGEMIVCEGIPGTAEVKGDSLGYYDAKGKFVEVAKGYGRVSEGDDDDFVKAVEFAEKIDNHIFLIRNEMSHASEDDIGWRYAYRRSKTEAVCVDIKSGKETVLQTVGK